MKKIIVIFLLLQIISNNAFAEELIKLPSLFQHYNHHKISHNKDLTFINFLKIHYSDINADTHNTSHDEDDKDCNLPFKHCNDCCFNIHIPLYGLTSNYVSAICNYIIIQSFSYININENISCTDLCSIWQPPKLV
ncbi:MAG: hypothetical protein LCH32_12010 [Bacteroidetes bacterium]|nr:hypothetical protein [Bacteroidota bacterium]